MAFSYFIRSLQCGLLQQNIFDSDEIGSVTPGSEIPRWFNNQHVNRDYSFKDSHICIDASPVMHDKTWVGVMCCVVFKIGHEWCYPYFSLGNINISVDIDEKEFVSESVADIPEHMYLFFVKRRSEFILLLNFDCGGITKVYDVKVEKYGYRWIYEQDLELLNVTMMQSGNSSARKRKFWGIEEKEGKRSKASMSAELRKDDDANSSLEKRIMLLQNQFQNLGL